ncbi:MAG: cupin domain-containing protein [Gammaproteobacteria bacterium]|nr:MAG: cupin domain-containing protein [Gammaproteobacteria bacterium]
MHFPRGIAAADFLERHWQKHALFMPGALAADLPLLTPDELGWLATLDDVESRLIFTERSGAGCSYRLQHGPFSSDTLAALPERDWTLLVQDVEKHLPDFRRWIEYADFVPDWRVDDLMVSFAAPGGSAGPHRDHYDVFLCQGAGEREWRIAAENARLREVSADGLALLEPFHGDRCHVATPGDLLYLPPGIAHWGVARDACMTYSIGMRAPELADLQRGFERIFPGLSRGPQAPAEAQPAFYTDPDLAPGESIPGQITGQAVTRTRSAFGQLAEFETCRLIQVLGSAVTEPKAWLAPETPDADGMEALLRRMGAGASLAVHGMARLAWYSGEAGHWVFANGHSRALCAGELPLVQDLCRRRLLRPAAQYPGGTTGLLQWLLQCGLLDPCGDADENRSQVSE